MRADRAIEHPRGAISLEQPEMRRRAIGIRAHIIADRRDLQLPATRRRRKRRAADELGEQRAGDRRRNARRPRAGINPQPRRIARRSSNRIEPQIRGNE